MYHVFISSHYSDPMEEYVLYFVYTFWFNVPICDEGVGITGDLLILMDSDQISLISIITAVLVAVVVLLGIAIIVGLIV